jgi:hypothetical protein
MTRPARGKPGWQELIGIVGDDLIKAGKDMDRVEAEVNRRPNEKFREKAERYAGWADELAERLRAITADERAPIR